MNLLINCNRDCQLLFLQHLNTMLSTPSANDLCTGSTARSVAITFGIDVMNVQKMLAETVMKSPYIRPHLLPQWSFTAL